MHRKFCLDKWHVPGEEFSPVVLSNWSDSHTLGVKWEVSGRMLAGSLHSWLEAHATKHPCHCCPYAGTFWASY